LPMRHYFQTVTLGSFTWKNEERLRLLFSHISAEGVGVLFFHFLLITICLNFPVTFNIARAAPSEFYSRLYGETFDLEMDETEDFNLVMIESGYNRNVLLPMLVMSYFVILITLAVFYLCSAFFLRIARMNAFAMDFRSRLSLALFSSTLPALFSAVLGFLLPAVHIIVFCLAVIIITFQRSNILRNAE
jgi:hypothetical protein